MKDFYAILGVSQSVDEKDLKSAYRRLAKEYHPDTNKAPGAEAKFKEISEAYETLKDSSKRREYDMQRSGQTANPWGQGPYSQGFNHRPTGNVDINLDEILRDIRRSRNPFPEDARNRDIVLTYSITLEEVFQGKDASITYNLPGKDPQKIQFKVPKGVQDGLKLRFQGRGDDQMTNVSPGDLYIKIAIVPHHTFIRMGQHLVTSITVDYLDAILGTEKEVPTIEGGKIKMRVPAGILPGQSLRASGKGMSQNDVRGDMMVEIVFESPKLTEEQRALLIKAQEQKAA